MCQEKVILVNSLHASFAFRRGIEAPERKTWLKVVWTARSVRQLNSSLHIQIYSDSFTFCTLVHIISHLNFDIFWSPWFCPLLLKQTWHLWQVVLALDCASISGAPSATLTGLEPQALWALPRIGDPWETHGRPMELRFRAFWSVTLDLSSLPQAESNYVSICGIRWVHRFFTGFSQVIKGLTVTLQISISVEFGHRSFGQVYKVCADVDGTGGANMATCAKWVHNQTMCCHMIDINWWTLQSIQTCLKSLQFQICPLRIPAWNSVLWQTGPVLDCSKAKLI